MHVYTIVINNPTLYRCMICLGHMKGCSSMIFGVWWSCVVRCCLLCVCVCVCVCVVPWVVPPRGWDRAMSDHWQLNYSSASFAHEFAEFYLHGPRGTGNRTASDAAIPCSPCESACGGFAHPQGQTFMCTKSWGKALLEFCIMECKIDVGHQQYSRGSQARERYH